VKHDRSEYNRGCRCDECSEANRRYVSEWRQRRREAQTHRLLHGRWLRRADDSLSATGGEQPAPDTGRVHVRLQALAYCPVWLAAPFRVDPNEMTLCPAGGSCGGTGWVATTDDGGWQAECWCQDAERGVS